MAGAAATASGFRPSWRRPGPLRRLSGLLGRSVPLLVWGLAIAGIVLLLRDRHARLEYVGVAEAGRHTVSTLTSGRVQGLVVGERDPVEAGQILASLDDSDLVIRLVGARAELERLKAEVVRQEALLRLDREDLAEDRRTDHRTDRRRFLRDREFAALDVLETRATIEEDTIRRDGLAIEMERLRPLVEQGLAAESEWTRLETEHDAVAERVRQQAVVLADRESLMRSAERRLSEFDGSRPADPDAPDDALLAPFRFSIEAQSVELESIALARTRLHLRAPVSGRVEEILTRTGQVLAAGMPLMTIVETEPRALVAFVPEAQSAELRDGMTALVATASAPDRVLTTRVRAVGPASRALPTRFWTDPRVEQWGVPVYLEPPPKGFAVPGEALQVRLIPAPGPTGH